MSFLSPVANIVSNFLHSESQSQNGLKSKELTSILARMDSGQESFRKRNPDYWHVREQIITNVEQELQTRMDGRSSQRGAGECKNHVTDQWRGMSVENWGGLLYSDQWRGNLPTVELIYLYLCAVVQIRPRSSSLPSRTTQVMCGPAVKDSQTPQPAPRNKTPAQPKTSTPITKTTVKNFKSK